MTAETPNTREFIYSSEQERQRAERLAARLRELGENLDKIFRVYLSSGLGFCKDRF